jgi:RNA polymerase sigma factor (sigma-70 family)
VPTVPLEEASIPGLEPVVPDHEDRDDLRGMLARLPGQQRAVLVLRYYEDLSDDEIATALGCRVGTVRGYASRALATLRIELATIANEEANR